MQPDNLASLKDDMVAFIEGHSMRRLPGFVTDEIPTVLWEDDANPDSWKDFVEMAKSASAPFLTLAEVKLEKEDVEMLLEQLRADDFPGEDSPEASEAQFLFDYVGKSGYLQLGFPHQGIMFLHENATEWYEHYQQLLESLEDYQDLAFNGDDEAEERM